MGDRKPKIEQRILIEIATALLLIGVALLQTSLAPSIYRFRIDWVLLVVVGWTLLHGLVPGLRWAMYGGVALDVLQPLPLGTHLLALLICVIGVAYITEPLDREQPLLVVLVMLGSALAYGTIVTLVMHVTVQAVPWLSFGLTSLLPTALLNAVAGVPVFGLMRRIGRQAQLEVG